MVFTHQGVRSTSSPLLVVEWAPRVVWRLPQCGRGATEEVSLPFWKRGSSSAHNKTEPQLGESPLGSVLPPREREGDDGSGRAPEGLRATLCRGLLPVARKPLPLTVAQSVERIKGRSQAPSDPRLWGWSRHFPRAGAGRRLWTPLALRGREPLSTTSFSDSLGLSDTHLGMLVR